MDGQPPKRLPEPFPSQYNGKESIEGAITEAMRWNLVMITLDCVRPDHLGCYGYRGVETPRLDGLAADGVLFEQAVTVAPNTWVAHATLFTGCLPARHGLRAASHRISPEVVTLAEWLSGYGFTAAAFPGTSLVGRAQGFHRGFHLFDEKWQEAGWQVEDVSWRRDWKDSLGRAFEWMEEAPEPFFAWIHYMDTHHLPGCQLPEYFRRGFSPRWQFYDGKISFADQVCVGEILGLLDRRGLRERTVIVVFSDHGEELNDDGRPMHDGGLRDDVIRVPMIMGLPSEAGHPGLRVPWQVRLLDLFPTVCDLMDLSRPQDLQGRSLLPMLRGSSHDGGEDGRLAYLENWPRGLLGLRTPEWKLILRHPAPEAWDSAEPRVEGLYHLPTDGGERVDLSWKHPSVVEYLRAHCLERARGESPLVMGPEERERVERALRGLGYL